MVKASTDSKPVPKKIPNQGNKKTQAKTGSLQRPKDGRVEKATNKRPVSKKVMEANKNARKAIATGELASAEIELKKQKDLRTLYIKFKEGHEPTNETEVRSVCPSVQYIRMPRRDKNKIHYCFLEFNSEGECDKMKGELSNSPDRFFVDYVGEKSRNVKFTAKDVAVKTRPLNPLRLFISGLPANMTVAKLTKLFPKCSEAIIKSQGSPVGYVHFRNAGDAKSAFDAAQILSGNDAPEGVPKLTVFYARLSKRQSLAKREERKKKKTGDKKDGDEKKGENAEDAEVASDDKGVDDVEVKEESDNEEEVEGSGDAAREESDDDDEEVENDEDSEAEEMADE